MVTLWDHNLICVKPNILPYVKWDAVKQEIDSLLALDMIEKVMSPYSSPKVLVKKKDGILILHRLLTAE